MQHSQGIPSTPDLRLTIVRAYAQRVFGKELMASAWMGRPSHAVLEGACIVATACQTEAGYRQAMQELARIEKSLGCELVPPSAPPPAADDDITIPRWR